MIDNIKFGHGLEYYDGWYSAIFVGSEDLYFGTTIGVQPNHDDIWALVKLKPYELLDVLFKQTQWADIFKGQLILADQVYITGDFKDFRLAELDVKWGYDISNIKVSEFTDNGRDEISKFVEAFVLETYGD